MSGAKTARTYNQNHVSRKYTPGRRRVSIYISWSYPAEAGRNPAELDNRFSTMTEVRRVAWPAYEAPEWSDPLQFQQGIAGALELFFWAWVPFQQFVGETTGHVVPVFQRIDQVRIHSLCLAWTTWSRIKRPFRRKSRRSGSFSNATEPV